jgi:hypothetical protein
MGDSLQIRDVAFGSEMPQTASAADQRKYHRAKRQVCAMCGRLRVGKENLHVAPPVGAAMCSAC